MDNYKIINSQLQSISIKKNNVSASNVRFAARLEASLLERRVQKGIIPLFREQEETSMTVCGYRPDKASLYRDQGRVVMEGV